MMERDGENGESKRGWGEDAGVCLSHALFRYLSVLVTLVIPEYRTKEIKTQERR